VIDLHAVAAVELRRELDLPTDEVEFLRLSRETREAALAGLEQAAEALRAMASETSATANPAPVFDG
jgi:hypothetical protein